MGCLLELLFEILLEGFFELIADLYIKIVSWILPEHKFSERLRMRFKVGLAALSVVLFILLIVGLVLLMQEDPQVKELGGYMAYIPLAVMVTQALLGIIVKIFSRKRR